MVRSPVAAFYPLARGHFYRRGPFTSTDLHFISCGCTPVLRSKRSFTGCPRFCLQTEITFRRLDGCMPQQELNLLRLVRTGVGAENGEAFS